MDVPAAGHGAQSEEQAVRSLQQGCRHKRTPGPHRLSGVTGHIALWWHDIRWSEWMAVNSNRLDPLCARVCTNSLSHYPSARQGNDIFPSVEGKLAQAKWCYFLHLGWRYSKVRLQNLLLYNRAIFHRFTFTIKSIMSQNGVEEVK